MKINDKKINSYILLSIFLFYFYQLFTRLYQWLSTDSPKIT